MTITVNHTTARRIGVLVFTGVAAALVSLGTSGNAAASPVPFDPPSPIPPSNPRGSYTVNEVVQDWIDPPPFQAPSPVSPASPADLGDSVSLNPQPLPPGPDRGRRVGLNPQPLPPGPDLWRGFLMLPGF